MINVLHISTFHLSGGAALAAARLNRALNRFGVKSEMVVGKSSGQESSVSALDETIIGKALFWARFAGERLFFLRYEKDRSVRYAFSPAVTGKDLADHPLVKQADVIHLHWVNFGLLSIQNIGQLFNLGKPVVWTLHDMWAFTGGCHYSGECSGYESACGRCVFLRNPGVNDLSNRILEKKKQFWESTSRVSIVACSRWLGAKARSGSVFQASTVTSIPNPIDTSIFRPLDKADARSIVGVLRDKKYILFAAAKVSSLLKGFSFLKKALTLLVTSRPALREQLELIVIGGGDPDLLIEIPLKTHYMGYVTGDENLVNIYSAASVYVTPSLEDNLPNTVMESLACGTPVVGFRTGGIPEMVDHQVNGYLADYKSPESLAEGLQWVLENDSEGRLSVAAREKVLREYDEKVIVSKYRGLYEFLLSQ